MTGQWVRVIGCSSGHPYTCNLLRPQQLRLPTMLGSLPASFEGSGTRLDSMCREPSSVARSRDVVVRMTTPSVLLAANPAGLAPSPRLRTPSRWSAGVPRAPVLIPNPGNGVQILARALRDSESNSLPSSRQIGRGVTPAAVGPNDRPNQHLARL